MIYITKYALSKGIIAKEEVSHDDERALVEMTEGSGYRTMFHKGDWCATLEAAQAKAEEMRIKKLQSLDKQMKKISAMNFNEVSA